MRFISLDTSYSGWRRHSRGRDFWTVLSEIFIMNRLSVLLLITFNTGINLLKRSSTIEFLTHFQRLKEGKSVTDFHHKQWDETLIMYRKSRYIIQLLIDISFNEQLMVLECL